MTMSTDAGDANEQIDERVRNLARSSSPATREAVFEDLLQELMSREPTESEVPLVSARGVLLGFFVRPYAMPGAPEEVELAIKALRDRHHEFDPRDLISAADLIRQLGDRSPVGSR
jgi:hypothetical protein